MSKDPYYTLGISKDAEMKEVKKAYFHMAKKFHPDLNKDDDQAKATFQQIQEAYRFIQMQKDPALRVKHQKEFNEYQRGKDGAESTFKSKRGSKARGD